MSIKSTDDSSNKRTVQNFKFNSDKCHIGGMRFLFFSHFTAHSSLVFCDISWQMHSTALSQKATRCGKQPFFSLYFRHAVVSAKTCVRIERATIKNTRTIAKNIWQEFSFEHAGRIWWCLVFTYVGAEILTMERSLSSFHNGGGGGRERLLELEASPQTVY